MKREKAGWLSCVCVYTHAKRSMKWHLTQQILSRSLNKIHIHSHLSHSLRLYLVFIIWSSCLLTDCRAEPVIEDKVTSPGEEEE